MVSHGSELTIMHRFYIIMTHRKALANNVGNDEKKELAYVLDHKARVDLKSPWTIIRIIQYKSMNQVFMH